MNSKIGNVVNIRGSLMATGARGYSAYEIWLQEGNVGTQQDFLNSLKGTNKYEELPDKPSINGVTLEGNKTSKDLGLDSGYDDTDIRNQINTINQDLGGIQDEIQSINNNIDGLEDNKADKTSIPTKTSQLNNDSNFLTEIPIASSSRLGGIKVGANLTIDSDGTLNATGGGSGGISDYNGLKNKPQINGTTLSGNKTSSDIGVVDVDDALTEQEVIDLINQYEGEDIDLSAYAKKTEVPTKISQLTNDKNFIDNTYHDSTKQNVSSLETDVKAFINKAYITSLIDDGSEVSY